MTEYTLLFPVFNESGNKVTGFRTLHPEDLVASGSWSEKAMFNAHKLQGTNVTSSVPTTGNSLVFNGSQWIPSTLSVTGSYTGGDVSSTALPWTAGEFLIVTSDKVIESAGVTQDSPVFNAAKLKDFTISNTDPTTGQFLVYSGSEWSPSSYTPPGGSGGDANATSISGVALSGPLVNNNLLIYVSSTNRWIGSSITFPTQIDYSNANATSISGVALSGSLTNNNILLYLSSVNRWTVSSIPAQIDYSNANATSISGVALGGTLDSGDILVYNGSQWNASAPPWVDSTGSITAGRFVKWVDSNTVSDAGFNETAGRFNASAIGSINIDFTTLDPQQVLFYNGINWVGADLSGVSGISLNESLSDIGSVPIFNDESGGVISYAPPTSAAWNASAIQGITVSAQTPIIGQALYYTSAAQIQYSFGPISSVTNSSGVIPSTIDILLVDASGASAAGYPSGLVLTLPQASSLPGKKLNIIKNDPTGEYIQISSPSAGGLASINGSSIYMRYPYEQLSLLSDSSKWVVLSRGLSWGSGPQHYELFDDFNCGSSETGEVGILGWTFTNGTITQQGSTTSGSLGTIRRSCAATAGQVASFTLMTTTAATSKFFDFRECITRGALFASTASSIFNAHVRIGLSVDAGVSTLPANGAYFEYLGTSDTQWQAVAAGSSSRTVSSTGVFVSATSGANVTNFRIFKQNDTTYEYYINTKLVARITSTTPSTAGNAVYSISITPTNAEVKSFDVDYVSMRLGSTILRE